MSKKKSNNAVDLKSGKILVPGATIDEVQLRDYVKGRINIVALEKKLIPLFAEIRAKELWAEKEVSKIRNPNMRIILSTLPYVYLKRRETLEPNHAKSFALYLRDVYEVEASESYKFASVIEGLSRYPHLIKFLTDDIIGDLIQKLRTLFRNKENLYIQDKYLSNNKKSLELLKITTNKEISEEVVGEKVVWKMVPRGRGGQMPISYKSRGDTFTFKSELDGVQEVLKILAKKMTTKKNVTELAKFVGTLK